MKTGYWGFFDALGDGLAVDLAAGLAVDFVIGLEVGFDVAAALAVDFGAGLDGVAARAVPVIKKPEATNAARSFFNSITSFLAMRT
jgi:hypothetical protein